jgi:Mg-chelatase subunit ChlD
MSDKYPEHAQDLGPHQHAHAAPTTQQIRTVGQRRRDAEEKLEHHLDEARHKAEHEETAERDTETGSAGAAGVNGGDVAAIQNDERLTAADRVDLIANQVVAEPDDTEPDDKEGSQGTDQDQAP